MDKLRARNYVFTLNNYTVDEETRLKSLDCEWMIFGHEIAPSTGTPHLQGAICFNGRRYASAITKLFPRIHIEVMKGKPAASKDYCMKEDPTNYFEKGLMPEGRGEKGGAANKRKWDEAYNNALEGNFDEIPRDIWIRYMNSFKQIYNDHKQDPSMENFDDKDLKMHFLWLYGPTGTGKSHTAHRIAKELAPNEQPYLKDLNKWWNGYSHQKVTIIEEADPKRCEHLGSYFKKWADKWAFTAECKGTVFPACRPEYIIVTSNYSISQCFPDDNDRLPLERRFTEQYLPDRMHSVFWPLTMGQKILDRDNAPTGNTIPPERCPADVILTSSSHINASTGETVQEVSEESDTETQS